MVTHKASGDFEDLTLKTSDRNDTVTYCMRKSFVNTSLMNTSVNIYSFQRVYTKGRPPWYDREGKNLKQPYVIGICGGSASGKTTVARRIIERLEMPWVTVLSMDSFYKVFSLIVHLVELLMKLSFFLLACEGEKKFDKRKY